MRNEQAKANPIKDKPREYKDEEEFERRKRRGEVRDNEELRELRLFNLSRETQTDGPPTQCWTRTHQYQYGASAFRSQRYSSLTIPIINAQVTHIGSKRSHPGTLIKGPVNITSLPHSWAAGAPITTVSAPRDPCLMRSGQGSHPRYPRYVHLRHVPVVAWLL